MTHAHAPQQVAAETMEHSKFAMQHCMYLPPALQLARIHSALGSIAAAMMDTAAADGPSAEYNSADMALHG